MAVKIMHVGEYVKGGVYTYLYDLLDYQSEIQDTAVYLVASRNKSEDTYPISSENLFFYKYRRTPFYFIYAIMYIFTIIKKVKPDIIHVHSTFAGLFVRFLYLLKPNKKVKIVYCSHGWSFLMDTSNIYKKFYVLVERILSKVTTAIINISMFEQVESIKLGIPENKSILIYNGTKKNSFEKRSEITFPKIDKDKINILFVGRFDRQKGIDILVDSIKRVKNKKVHLYLIGDSVLSESFDMENLDNITKIGWIEKEKIDSYYQLVDAVVMPSRWEGFGLVAIEAMKNKKAVIASNRGALPELIKDNVNGYIFDLNDLDSLVCILESLDKGILEVMGKKGYMQYIEKFTSEKMNENILNVYNSLLEEKIVK
ncbi:glycosyl transferase [Priestia megaterium]|uniref:glycosyltransferase n=1 Tax=Priestia megaterium TaxID=1404 RepID=UPI000BFBD5B3|nr:glycosyltransferase [Priestia megaterium]PGT51020.1 glycosyl transferase [Priestia megaterium]